MQVYEPQEDSFLLQKQIVNYAKKKSVLEIGTGSGILACEAARYAKEVTAVDLNPNALKAAKILAAKHKIKNITFKKSDLFATVKKKFDLIVFNPPYLPADPKYPDIALDGGKHGYETVERFLEQVNDHLKQDGIILLLFSNLTKKTKVDQFIKEHLLVAKQIASLEISFEELYIYEIKKNDLLKQLETKNCSAIKYFKKGKRGIIYQAQFKKQMVLIKAPNKNSTAINRIENEINMLNKLSTLPFTPKLYFTGKDYFAMEYIDGLPIQQYIEVAMPKNILKVLRKTLDYMFELDQLGINKEEMHRPIKHLLITKKHEVKLIDYERANNTISPKNVTQFCQFIRMITPQLKKKCIGVDLPMMQQLSKQYRKQQTKTILKEIKNQLTIF